MFKYKKYSFSAKNNNLENMGKENKNYLANYHQMNSRLFRTSCIIWAHSFLSVNISAVTKYFNCNIISLKILFLNNLHDTMINTRELFRWCSWFEGNISAPFRILRKYLQICGCWSWNKMNMVHLTEKGTFQAHLWSISLNLIAISLPLPL